MENLAVEGGLSAIGLGILTEMTTEILSSASPDWSEFVDCSESELPKVSEEPEYAATN